MPSSFNALFFLQSIFPSFRLFHSIGTPLSPPLLLLCLWLAPCGCAFEGNVLKHIKKRSAACCSLRGCTCVSAVPLPWYSAFFKHRACYSESTLGSYLCFLEALFPWGNNPIAISTMQGSECTNPRLHSTQCVFWWSQHMLRMLWQCPLLLCLLAVFSLFLCLPPSCSCVYISFCCLLLCCRSQSQSLFAPASFVPLVWTHVSEALREAVG